ncbi:hypothetical protein Tco_0605426 [Tanacetum coccineum]
MVPRAVLMKSGLVSINTTRQNISKTAVLVNTAKQVNAANSKTTVNDARPMSYLSITTHSTFWSSAVAKTINGEVQLHALVDGKRIVITETFVRSTVQLADAEGIDYFLNSIIFENLAFMGLKTTAWNEFSNTMASAIICLATNQKFNFSKLIFDSMVRNLDNLSGSGSRCQETMGDIISQTRFENVSKLSNDSLLARVLDLEKTKTTQAEEIVSLKRRVKKLEQKKRSRTHGLKRLRMVGATARVGSSKEEEVLGEDASKYRRSDNVDTLFRGQDKEKDHPDLTILTMITTIYLIYTTTIHTFTIYTNDLEDLT